VFIKVRDHFFVVPKEVKGNKINKTSMFGHDVLRKFEGKVYIVRGVREFRAVLVYPSKANELFKQIGFLIVL
jgi:hypothetical protein